MVLCYSFVNMSIFISVESSCFCLNNRLSHLFVAFVAVIQIFMYYYEVRYCNCVFHLMSLN